MTASETKEALISRKEAARQLGISHHTLTIWAISKKYITPVKIGRRAMYHQRDVDRLKMEGTDAAKAPTE